MRADMGKVVMERARTGSRLKTPKSSRRAVQRTPTDELPTCEAMRRKWLSGWYQERTCNQCAGPLRGYILKQVGRLWDDVYSEIAQVFPQGGNVLNHARSTLLCMVAQNISKVVDGEPYDSKGDPVSGNRSWEVVYVHPVTQRLVKSPVRRRWVKPCPADEVRITPLKRYKQLNGVWYFVELIPQADGHWLVFDAVLNYLRKTDTVARRKQAGLAAGPDNLKEWGQSHGCHEVREFWGGRFCAVSMRQLTRKELKTAPLPKPKKVLPQLVC